MATIPAVTLLCWQVNAVLEIDGATVYHGNNLDILPTLPNNSVDSIVTDPPYELGFMGKKWDSSGIAYNVDLWRECLRVLKPGGHLLSFGGTRTWHRIAVAIEDAGFEVRDSIAWMYGSGFPKSLDISKAIDKAAGAVREVIGEKVSPDGIPYASRRINGSGPSVGGNAYGEYGNGGNLETAPATPEAQQWQGWGTALKPAFEPIIVARKPIEGTVAANVLKWETGGLNIDASRIETETITINTFDNGAKPFGDAVGEPCTSRESQGRWPANLILDETAAAMLDEQSGISKSRTALISNPNFKGFLGSESINRSEPTMQGHNDSGGASRFFYVAKASKRDRNEGLDELEGKSIGAKGNGLARTCAICSASVLDGCNCPDRTFVNPTRQNFHPTVKPTALMEYLIKLVTPPSGIVLDPFTGSGSTGKAALLNGFQFVGIEMTEEYFPIIEGRLRFAASKAAEEKEKGTLF